MADDGPDELPEGPLQISIYGRKGQGKTEWAWSLWDTWDGDCIVVDPNNDCLANHPEDEPVLLTDEMLVAGWPEYLRVEGEPIRLRYVPDPADERTYRENLDRVVGLAFSHPYTLLWFDEFSEVAQVNRVGPHTRRALRMGRHVPLWLLLTDIRPITVDPLGLAQADVVVMYDVPSTADRKRLADLIGMGVDEFSAEMDALEDHGYLRYIAATKELSSWPPLPLKGPRAKRRTATDMLEGDPDE